MIKKITYTPQQTNFINNDSDFLIVSAGPGSGKTQSLVGYLDELKLTSNTKSILVCSFTNNSTNDIKGRFKEFSKSENDKFLSFKTFDAFMISDIWNYFFNRIINFSINFFIPGTDLMEGMNFKNISYVEKKWSVFINNYTNAEWIKNEVDIFVRAARDGVLISNVISEFLLFNYMKNNSDIIQYLTSRFERIVIDEAQDLNKIRKQMLLFLYESGVKLTFVGDEKQSLYSFSGAENDSFTNLIKIDKYDIELIELTENFRFEGIKKPENKHLEKIFLARNSEEMKAALGNAAVNGSLELVESLTETVSKINDDSVLVITNTNIHVKEISADFEAAAIEHDYREKFQDGIKHDFRDISFIENLYVYNELKNGRLKASDLNTNIIQNITDFIWPGDPNSSDKFLKLFWKKGIKYRESLLKLSRTTKIEKMMHIYDSMVLNHHLVSILPISRIQIMTIHGSKGLEADYVFIPQKLIEQFMNGGSFPGYEGMYVALSRAKKKILLF